MINYNDGNIFLRKNKKCLTFDPFETKDELFSIKINDSKKQQKFREEYYSCSENCFDVYENLPVFNYHYEISCLCIKDCYEKLKKRSIV